MIVTFRNYSRYALGTIEILLGIYLLVNSAIPLVAEGWEVFSEGPKTVEQFLLGVGPQSVAFWLRILACFVGLGMIFTPMFADSKKTARIRTRLNFAAFILFTYVGILATIFADPKTFFWIAPIATGLMSAITYIGNSAEARRYE